MTQMPSWSRNRRPSMALVARTADDPDAVVGTIRRAVAEVDPKVPVYAIQPMTEFLGSQTEQSRLSVVLMTGFAALAAIVATVGLYGVLAYLVAQRTREIGVRLALGARRADVVKGVVGQGLVLALIGLAVGLATAVAAVRLLSDLLFEVSPTDLTTFLTVAGGLALVSLVACLVPARRASSVDPLIALRTE
jgi:putative ABC transport system permease protein